MSAVSEVARQTGDGGFERSENPTPVAGLSTFNSQVLTPPHIALLTGGGDKPYALGIAEALTSAGIALDFIGSDDLEVPELSGNPKLKFFNLRGDQRPNVGVLQKLIRVGRYYLRLFKYAATAKPRLFHILWNNKIELFDRTLLMLYYRVLGKRIVLTAHNVNARKRDLNDSWFNRVSLKIQYKLSDCIFVHTEAMKTELIAEYMLPDAKVRVIPFGINNTVPRTNLSSTEARQRLDLNSAHKAILFFGNIAPYKGLEYLVNAFVELARTDETYRLIIVGKPKGLEKYWTSIKGTIERSGIANRTLQVIEYIPDEAIELYFKAADVLVLPYTRVFQSGVLFLSYSFGLPVIAADVASLKDEIVNGKTGFVFEPCNSNDLATKIREYFGSGLFRKLEAQRLAIREYGNDRYSWDKVVSITTAVYSRLLHRCLTTGL
jgi:glycosyltransferase involved in cell wall biosynthesis